jgi:chromosome segregation ATPase
MTNVQVAVAILAALGLLGGIGSGIKAWLDRSSIRSKSNLDDTTATINLAAAAREMLDPLRKELAQERAEHSAELEAERVKVRQVRAELASALEEAKELRGELAMARVEADELRRDRERYREKDRLQAARIRDLERRLGLS